MAKNILPVDFKDDILSEEMAGRRKYQMITNADGTVSFVDVTEYDQVGSNLGQAQINATNAAVNESADKNKIIDAKADLMANTQEGMIAGALAVKELGSELTENIPFPLAIQDGQYGYIAAGEDGADTFVPFSSVYYLGAGTSFDISALFPALDYTKLSVNNFLVCASNTSRTVATTNVGGTTRSSVASGNTIGISYDNTTGLLKITGTAQTISFVSSGDTYASANQILSCKVYLVIGNVHII